MLGKAMNVILPHLPLGIKKVYSFFFFFFASFFLLSLKWNQIIMPRSVFPVDTEMKLAIS